MFVKLCVFLLFPLSLSIITCDPFARFLPRTTKAWVWFHWHSFPVNAYRDVDRVQNTINSDLYASLTTSPLVRQMVTRCEENLLCEHPDLSLNEDQRYRISENRSGMKRPSVPAACSHWMLWAAARPSYFTTHFPFSQLYHCKLGSSVAFQTTHIDPSQWISFIQRHGRRGTRYTRSVLTLNGQRTSTWLPKNERSGQRQAAYFAWWMDCGLHLGLRVPPTCPCPGKRPCLGRDMMPPCMEFITLEAWWVQCAVLTNVHQWERSKTLSLRTDNHGPTQSDQEWVILSARTADRPHSQKKGKNSWSVGVYPIST